MCCRWFGRLLLEGKVLKELTAVLTEGTLKETPASLTQAKLSDKVASLLGALSIHKVIKRPIYCYWSV